MASRMMMEMSIMLKVVQAVVLDEPGGFGSFGCPSGEEGMIGGFAASSARRRESMVTS